MMGRDKYIAGTIVKSLNKILLLWPKNNNSKDRKLIIPSSEVYSGNYLENAIESLRDSTGIIVDKKRLDYLGKYEIQLPGSQIIYDLYELESPRFYVKLDKEKFDSHEWVKTRVFKHRKDDLQPGLAEIIDSIYSNKK